MANTESKTRNMVLLNRYGMHVRPAGLFAKVASRFKADVKVEKDGDGNVVSGKSIMALMTLEAVCGSTLTVTANARSVRIRRLPEVDGIRWSGGMSSRSSMTSMSYSSGPSGAETVITSQTGVVFTAEKEGRYTIPPFEVSLNGKPAMTPSFTLRDSLHAPC